MKSWIPAGILSRRKNGKRRSDHQYSYSTGEKLTLESVRESIFGEWLSGERDAVSVSFLALYPGLKDILPEKSNIIMFQNQFQIVETDWDEREAEWRIWGKVQRN